MAFYSSHDMETGLHLERYWFQSSLEIRAKIAGSHLSLMTNFF
ncbi:MAG: hypothetical protein K0R08_2305 [Solimicrobium sp.]|jgi:hypothetical protein|nr:hypothetical protein [Solimicrobium sp.]